MHRKIASGKNVQDSSLFVHFPAIQSTATLQHQIKQTQNLDHMKRSANAIWLGTLKKGVGNLSSQSKILNKTPYSFVSRFQNQTGTNPEELMAAAHAGCFTMQLSADLTKAGFIPEELNTESVVSLEEGVISKSALKLSAKVPGISQDQFFRIAHQSKENCPVSKAFNLEITLVAHLHSCN
jgi:osmotically inducible protein OsmC